MTRTSQLLHAQRQPVPARAASTALFLRDVPVPGGPAGATQLEVLMSRRSDKARFAANHYVFPGGSIDAEDALHHDQLAKRPTQTTDELTYAQAAIRESLEEMGVLLARRADGSWATQADVAQIDRNLPLLPQCAQLGLTLAADALWPLARWTAALEIPIRFDVPFLVARMPEGQAPVTDDAEQFEALWVAPGDAIARADAGEMTLMFPTQVTLQHLAKYANVQAVIDALQGGPLWHTLPRGGLVNGQVQRFMEHETVYGELAMVCPDGQLHHTVGWQSAQPVPLLKNLLRLTADNGGTMTGPGTNTYIVGDAATGFIVVDPGPKPQPDNDPHLARILAATGGDIRAIVCTHSHADHSPGAFVLQQLCQAQGASRPLIYGLPSAPTASASAQFTPDQALQDGEQLTLAAPAPAGQNTPITHTLRAVFTPGHAANHVCLVLEEDELLFSGDHILNGSTPIVNPPDGNMDAYLRSLDKLDAICAQEEIDFILPAHGYVLGAAREVIARLKSHRLAREAKVIAAMRALPGGSMQDWVAHAYADTPQPLWRLAERSLLAHVERIQALGLA